MNYRIMRCLSLHSPGLAAGPVVLVIVVEVALLAVYLVPSGCKGVALADPRLSVGVVKPRSLRLCLLLGVLPLLLLLLVGRRQLGRPLPQLFVPKRGTGYRVPKTRLLTIVLAKSKTLYDNYIVPLKP